MKPKSLVMVGALAIGLGALPAVFAGSGADLDRRLHDASAGAEERRGPLQFGSPPRPVAATGAPTDPLAATFLGSALMDVPTPEVQPGGALPTVANHDKKALAFGRTDGQVAVVGLEDFRVWSRHSADGGGTFGAEVAVDGAVPVIHDIDGRLSGDGKIYLASIGGDPSLGVAARFARSDDVGQTWTAPVALTQNGDLGHFPSQIRIATGPAGRAAIVWVGNGGHDVFVSATTDSGGTWTAPVRVDGGTAGAGWIYGIAVAVDNANRVHAAFAQDLGASSAVSFTRSTNGGVTFSAPTTVAVASHEWSSNPDLAVAQDGNMLLSFFDTVGNDIAYVLRSTDGGVSYVSVLGTTAGNGSNQDWVPRLVVDPATPTTFLHVVTDANTLRLYRSTNAGLVWGALTTIASAAAGQPGALRRFSDVFLVRTSPSNWVIAWSDQRADTFSRLRTDVWARATTKDGAVWDAEARVPQGKTAGTSESWLTGMTAYGANNVFLAYRDGRGSTDVTTDIWANRSGVPLSFPADARVDADSGAVTPSMGEVTVVSDGGSRLYYAFVVIANGTFPDVFVTSSTDGGLSFSTPVRVASAAPGSRFDRNPTLRAFPDGRVYLLYQSDQPPGGTRQLRFTRSSDFGATWPPANDVLLGSLSLASGFYDDVNTGQRLAATADGTVYVVWSNSVDIFLRRSTDFGATFSAPTAIDQDSTGVALFPLVCADGDQLLVQYGSLVPAQTHYNFYAVVSEDRGATFGPRAEVRNAAINAGIYYNDMACGPAGTHSASVVWGDDRTAPLSFFSNRFDGTSWSGEGAVSLPAGVSCYNPDVEFSSATEAIVGYECADGTVQVSRSTDGGATYPTSHRLDDAASEPGANSGNSRIVTDGAGNVWASFFDNSAGLDSFVVRHSRDGGLTFGGLYRVNHEMPQGTKNNEQVYGFPIGREVAARGGIAWFGWAGQRASYPNTVLLNRWDANDFDADGVGALLDCNDADPTVFAVPVEVAGVVMEKVAAAVRIRWASQDGTAGPSTAYDLVTGALGDLRSTGSFGAAWCLVPDVADTPFDDTTADPSAGEGYYYLARAHNGCGIATYGNSSLGTDPRDALDTSSPCP